MWSKEIKAYKRELKEWEDYLAAIENMTEEEIQVFANTDETKEEAIAIARKEISDLRVKIDDLIEDSNIVTLWGAPDPAFRTWQEAMFN